MTDYVRFTAALKEGACDVVDAMLERGYIPPKKSITIVCKRGNVDLFNRLIKYPMNLQKGLIKAINTYA